MQPASATRDDAIPSVGSEELAEGLMLVRASTLKVIRLQLAMERRDRRVALEAVDDLVAIDRSLEQFLAQVPSAQDDNLFGNVLELERSALNIEKHTLAAGISNRNWQAEAAEYETQVGVQEDAGWTGQNEDVEPARRLPRILAILGALAVVVLAYLLGAAGVAPAFIRGIL